MAEVFHIAAGSTQFNASALNIAETGKAIYEKLQNAPEQIPKWLQDIDGLRDIVNSIGNYPELHDSEMALLVQTCVTIGQDLCRLLGEICISSEDPFKNQSWEEIVEKAKENNVRALFDTLGRVKSNLYLKTDTAHLNQNRNIHFDLNGLEASFEADSEDRKCLQALFTTNPNQDRADIIMNRGEICPGTCQWIFATQEFKTWEQTSPSRLWISAPPGVGKTYMSIFLSRHFESLAEKDSNLATIFFFCDNKNQSRNTAISIIRGLMYQLIRYQPKLMDIILPKWKTQKSALFQGNSLHQLWECFKKMVESLEVTTLYCVVDALDECQESSLQTLLEKFDLLGTDNQGLMGKLKLIYLSRKQPESISVSTSTYQTVELDMMTPGKEDIQRFISQRVLELAKKKNIVSHPLRRQK